MDLKPNDSRIRGGSIVGVGAVLALVLAQALLGCGSDSSPMGGSSGDEPGGHVGHTGVHSEEGLPSGSRGTSQIQIRASEQELGAGDGTGAFRTTCEFSHMRYDDPIVFPGIPGRSHLHTFFGNTMTDSSSTASSLRNSGNSTCRGGIINRTSYWVPALLDAAGDPLTPQTANFYYKSGYRGVPPEEIQPFPDGLRMIAGDATATSEQESDVAYWTCDEESSQHFASIPDCDPGTRLQMHVEFPQCWDGRNLDSEDHKSHMAYPGREGCPASHPVAIPAITFNIPYLVPQGGTEGLRLASDNYAGGEGGFSAHGDWFDGWDPEIVRVWVEDCVNTGLDCHSHLLGDGREIYYRED